MKKLTAEQMQAILGCQGNYTREDWRTRYGNYIKSCQNTPGFNIAFRPLPIELWVEMDEPETLSQSRLEYRWWIKHLINK